ncbi:MAG: acyltransferase [Chloroflexi bacterium]|nr:acyltransferase [Chloroflexota bacterium]
MPRTRNLTIDSLRLLATLEVIALHVSFSNLPDSVNVLIRLQARWAVPFFFIVSGYFFAQRLADPRRADVRPALYRLIWLFVLWSILYIPLVISEHEVKEVFRRLLFPSFIYIGEYFHLWFPSSLVLGFITLLFMFHYKLEKWILPLSLGILAQIMLAGAYNQVFNLKFPFDFVIARHWLSIPALYLGVWLFRRGPLNRGLALALTLGGLALQVFEAWFLYTRFSIPPTEHEVLLGTLPFAFGLASLGVSGVRFLENPTLSAWGRDFSLGIYLLHMMVIFAVGKTLKALIPVLDGLTVWDILYPFVILMLCIGLFAAMRRWLPALFKFLMGDHLSHSD